MSKIGKTVKKLCKALCDLRQDILRLNCRSACIHVVQKCVRTCTGGSGVCLCARFQQDL